MADVKNHMGQKTNFHFTCKQRPNLKKQLRVFLVRALQYTLYVFVQARAGQPEAREPHVALTFISKFVFVFFQFECALRLSLIQLLKMTGLWSQYCRSEFIALLCWCVTLTINLAEKIYVKKGWGDVHVCDVALCGYTVQNVALGL